MKTRSAVLDEMGNLDAEPGSRDWAISVLRDIQSTLNDINGDAAHLKVMVGLFREHRGYRILTNRRGKPFGLWDQFVSEPQPFGLGVDPDDLDQTIKERTARQAQELAATLAPKGPNGVKVNDITFDNVKGDITPLASGNETSYLTARIARDRPDILEKMKAGEFPSVRAAALEAGIVEPCFQCPADPIKASRRILRHFEGERLATLLAQLANHAGYELTPKE